VFEGGAWFFALREFGRSMGKLGYFTAIHRAKDPSVFVVLFEDSAAMLGLVVAFAGIVLSQTTGILYFDGAASVLIGLILIGTATWLAYETKGLLIGEAADEDLVEDIIGVAGRASFVDGVNEARTIHFGPMDVLVNLSVDARNALSAGEVETGITALEARIKERHPEISRVFIEIQAARDSDDPVPDPGDPPLPA